MRLMGCGMPEGPVRVAPAWWDTLVGDPVVAGLGVSWYPPEEWKTDEESEWAGTIRVPEYEDADERRRAGMVAVAAGPAVARRMMGFESPVRWYLDRLGRTGCGAR